MTSVSTTLCLPASLESLAALSNALYDFVAPFTLDPSLVYQVDLASCEAFTNIVKHAVKYDENQEIIVTLGHDGCHLTLTLSDAGVAIPDKILRQWPRSSNLLPDPLLQSTWPEGGMGLMLIQSMMDDINYKTEDGYNILRLTKHIPNKDP
jgi:serine/threonine-protein kinase RsbW